MTEAEKKALELYPTSLNLDRIMEISACRKSFLKGVEHAKQSDREGVKCRNCDEPHGEGCCCEPQPQEKVDEIAREEAEARALELYPIHPEFDVDRLKPLREAYLQGWEDSQQDKQTCGFCVEPKNEEK